MALQCLVTSQPGEERSIIFTLGEGDNADHARELAAKYRDPEQVEARIHAHVSDVGQAAFGRCRCETPDPA